MIPMARMAASPPAFGDIWWRYLNSGGVNPGEVYLRRLTRAQSVPVLRGDFWRSINAGQRSLGCNEFEPHSRHPKRTFNPNMDNLLKQSSQLSLERESSNESKAPHMCPCLLEFNCCYDPP
jgi:hypothetical protein